MQKQQFFSIWDASEQIPPLKKSKKEDQKNECHFAQWYVMDEIHGQRVLWNGDKPSQEYTFSMQWQKNYHTLISYMLRTEQKWTWSCIIAVHHVSDSSIKPIESQLFRIWSYECDHVHSTIEYATWNEQLCISMAHSDDIGKNTRKMHCRTDSFSMRLIVSDFRLLIMSWRR